MSKLIQQENAQLQIAYAQRVLDDQSAQRVEGRIFNRDELVQRIRQGLEQVAVYVFGQKSEAERQLLAANLKRQVEASLNLFNMEGYLSEIANIMIEQINLPISDSRFDKGRYNDELQQAMYDDGIVQTSLDQKLKKLEIFEAFFADMVLPVFFQKNPEFNPD